MRRFLVWLGMLTMSVPAVAEVSSAPADLKEFGLVCFCNSRIATPHMIVGYDNNGAVLFNARSGATRDTLKAAGTPITDSQVRLLKDWGLLTEKDQILTTSFPVLDPANMAKVRERLTPVEKALLPGIDPDVAAIKSELRRRGFTESAYAVLFSYVLDGRVWHQLDSSGKLPKTDITVEHPFWAGTFWAVYPKQDAMPGTNAREEGRLSLRMMWNPAVLEPINAFYGAKASGAFLKALDAGQPLPPLFDDPGVKPLIIREDQGDPIFSAADRIAEKVAQAMLRTDLSAEMPQADESQRLLIGTHEMIWLILADQAARHGIAPPRVLTTGASTSSDLAPLVMVSVSPSGMTAKH